MRLKVLIIEDEKENREFFDEMFKTFFGEEVNVLAARTLIEAKMMFIYHRDIDYIFVDACIESNQPNTANLVSEFRKSFTGPIIAMSSVEEYNNPLIAAGATRSCRKSDIWKMIPKTGS